jgi:hypothetical protein
MCFVCWTLMHFLQVFVEPLEDDDALRDRAIADSPPNSTVIATDSEELMVGKTHRQGTVVGIDGRCSVGHLLSRR